jgi:fatty-acyl-CoA synthase
VTALSSPRPSPAQLAQRALVEARSLAYIARAGILAPQPPRQLLEIVRAFRDYGQIGAAIASAGVRYGERAGIVDELGTLTFAELDERSSALASALSERGVQAGDCVGILCRNHRGFLDITFAAGKLGTRVLYLNTDFAGPQLRDVCRREAVSLLVHDEEYTELVADIEAPRGRITAWADVPGSPDSLEALIAAHTGRRAPINAADAGAVVLLTSGTTGTPKGAPRHSGPSLHPLGALLSKVPYRSGESTYVAAPMFHGLGFTQTILAVVLGSTVITHRRFKPEQVLDAVSAQRPTGLVLVPVMLQRIVSLLEDDPGRWSTDSLRVVFLSGAQLEAELVRRAHRTIGEKLYNFYGTTEVAWATFATPEDLRAAPGCAGRVPFGTVLRLYGGDGRPIQEPGETGRIFVGNGFQFEGYTGGGHKEMIDGLMSTGDVGHFDAAGRLFVDGRDDDMIVSGGENVFPAEVEELLVTHPDIEEAAVIGVPDAEFGQRLAAFVMRRGEAELSEDEVKAFVKENLARYKIPREVIFLPELPRNPTGKVLKRSLRELHRETLGPPKAA